MMHVKMKVMWRVPALRGSHPFHRHTLLNCEKKGMFDVLATDLVSVEGCWGLMLDYTAEVSFMGHSASRDLNSALLGALTTGGGVADIRPLPIELDEGTVQTDTGW